MHNETKKSQFYGSLMDCMKISPHTLLIAILPKVTLTKNFGVYTGEVYYIVPFIEDYRRGGKLSFSLRFV